MKNLFNNISQEEKNTILEMHSGKKTVISEDENTKTTINENFGPVPEARIYISYVGAPNNIDEDKINRCMSEVKRKVDEVLTDVFDVPINFVKVSFNNSNHHEMF